MREQIADDKFPVLLGWKTVTDAAIGAVQLQVFDALQHLVEQHKNQIPNINKK